MNRLRYTILQRFCPFLLFFFGCTPPKEIPFFDKYEIRQSRVATKVHRAETFPRSFKLDGVKRNLLLAGTRHGLSFFVEYYEFDTDPPRLNEIVEMSEWYKDSSGTHFHEKEFSILNENYSEVRIFRREPPYMLYGSFLIQGDSVQNIYQFIPEIYGPK